MRTSHGMKVGSLDSRNDAEIMPGTHEEDGVDRVYFLGDAGVYDRRKRSRSTFREESPVSWGIMRG